MEGVGPQLDAGTDLADLRGLLQHGDLEALANQGQGCRQTANATTGDDDGKLFIACDHVDLRKPQSNQYADDKYRFSLGA